MKWSTLWGICSLIVLLVPLTARADGKFIPPTARANITIPDQAALIRYANGEEYLAIDTRFVGEGKDLAWVIPLPSTPFIEPVTRGLFPTLRTRFAPDVVDTVTRYWISILVIAVCVAFVYSRPKGQRRARLVELFALLFIVVLLAGILLPSLGRSLPPGVRVGSEGTVGSYDVATLTADGPGDLKVWLTDHGFTLPAELEPVVAQYIKDGWVFAAIKLHRDEAGGLGAPHPMGFRFKTPQCVYPLRLTGVNNGKLRVELYVFSDQRAQAEYFHVEKCETLAKDAIGHPEMSRIVGDSRVMTKLIADLDETQMERDAVLRWTPPLERTTVLYSDPAALTTGVNYATLLAVIAIGTLWWLRRGFGLRRFVMWHVRIALVALALFTGIYVALPKVQVTRSVMPEMFMGSDHSGLARMIQEAQNENPVLSMEDAQKMVRDKWVEIDEHHAYRRRDQSYEVGSNLYQGGPVHEEDSPGNFTLDQNEAGYIEYTWYDRDGNPRTAEREPRRRHD